jgi:dATP pyrophosphohydrolase
MPCLTRIQPRFAGVFVVKIEDNQARFLLIRRCGKILKGNWQMVTGKVEEGETAWQAAIREVKEETSLTPLRLYTADYVERFYEALNDTIYFVASFVAFVNENAQVTLSPAEHDAFQWLSYAEARQILEFSGQRAALDQINDNFLLKTPNERFRIFV